MLCVLWRAQSLYWSGAEEENNFPEAKDQKFFLYFPLLAAAWIESMRL